MSDLNKENVKIYNGDCLKILKDISDKSVDLIVTDPPYGMNFQSNHRSVQYEPIVNDQDLKWMSNFVEESYRVLKDDTAIYAFCSWHNIDVFKREFEKKFTIKNILIWEKNNTSMGDLKGSYAPKYEMIIYAHKGRRELNGYRYADVLKSCRTKNDYHPTEKPVELLRLLIENSSKEQDTVLDCFMGSGSTGVASVISGRKFIGIEINDTYFNTAKYRIQEASHGIQGSLFSM